MRREHSSPSHLHYHALCTAVDSILADNGCVISTEFELVQKDHVTIMTRCKSDMTDEINSRLKKQGYTSCLKLDRVDGSRYYYTVA